MKKILFTMIAVAISIVSVNSQTMTVKLKDGTKVTYQTSTVENVEFEEAYNPGEGATYHNGHEYVDLGLPSGKLWATCNMGALKPEDNGEYFAWGETKSKDCFTEKNSETLGKNIGNNISGTDYDAAHVQWGGAWRMPTQEEFSEMTSKCTWSYYNIYGVIYNKGVGPNGNVIIIPLNGMMDVYDHKHNSGEYWTSETNGSLYNIYTVHIGGGSSISCGCLTWRHYGLGIRPIFTPEN